MLPWFYFKIRYFLNDKYFLSFKTKFEENNMKFEVTITRFNEQKSKIRDFNYAFNVHFYFFTENVTNIEIQTIS